MFGMGASLRFLTAIPFGLASAGRWGPVSAILGSRPERKRAHTGLRNPRVSPPRKETMGVKPFHVGSLSGAMLRFSKPPTVGSCDDRH